MTRRLRPADWFWLTALVLLGVAVGYNLFFAPDGGTISEAADGYFKRWPWLRPVILMVARHVANDLEPDVDPIGIAFDAARAIFHRRPAVVVVVD
jgi:hypothetical protein